MKAALWEADGLGPACQAYQGGAVTSPGEAAALLEWNMGVRWGRLKGRDPSLKMIHSSGWHQAPLQIPSDRQRMLGWGDYSRNEPGWAHKHPDAHSACLCLLNNAANCKRNADVCTRARLADSFAFLSDMYLEIWAGNIRSFVNLLKLHSFNQNNKLQCYSKELVVLKL